MHESSRHDGANTWAVIPGFSAYEVNLEGDVRRRFPGLKRAKTHHPKGYVLRGYRRHYLIGDDGVKKKAWAHRIVLLAFGKPQPSPSHVVAHGDGNPLNNSFDNLRWATVAENNADTARHGSLKGEENPAARMTAYQVAEARSRYSGRRGEQTSLAREYGLGVDAMRSILIGESWTGLEVPERFRRVQPMGNA